MEILIKIGDDEMTDTSKSSSYEQQNAEGYIASIVEEWLGCPVERNARILLLYTMISNVHARQTMINV